MGAIGILMPVDECTHLGHLGRLTDGAGNIQRVEIAGIDEAIHGTEIDMVGIDVVRLLPAQRTHRGIGGCPDAVRLAAYNQVLTVGLVPNRDHIRTTSGALAARFQLGLRLMSETVAHAERVFFQRQH